MTPKNTPYSAASHNKLDLDLQDEKFMRQALNLAKKAGQIGEVPIGAILVDGQGKVLARATNLREQIKSTLGHAELVAIHRACKKLNSWRLIDCTLYVTLEPCFMCSGALVQSRISRVVYGAPDPKGGALHSLANLAEHPKLNHKFQVTAGVLGEECSKILKDFFKKKRNK
jgi:tRNA(adenine34) deaminase